MEYVATTVTSPPGLSQEEALEELQKHPKYKAGSRIKAIRQRGDRWSIRVMEPKTAEFPPPSDEESDGGPSGPSETNPDDSDDDSDDSDGDGGKPPFPPKDDEGDDKGSEKGEIGEVLKLLHTLLDALGLDTGAGPPGAGPDAGPPPPPPGPPGAGGPPGAEEHGGARPGAGRPPTKPMRDVPPGANPISGFASARHMATQVPAFTAVAQDDGAPIKQAKAELENLYGPYYKIKQIKRDSGRIAALMSVR